MDIKLPRHIGMIMDGNGRWATRRNLPKVMGHREGYKTVDRIVEDCVRRGIQALTLYAFSTENWKRPKGEVDTLMQYFQEAMRDKSEKLHSNNVRFQVIGRVSALPDFLKKQIADIEALTAGNTGLCLSIAMNYGGRQEIVDAVRRIVGDIGVKGLGPEEVDESSVEERLYTKGLPELDLLIRTSGEMRVSNFLLWQIAYAEIYVTDKLWPDFGTGDMEKALEEYSRRDRRFGG